VFIEDDFESNQSEVTFERQSRKFSGGKEKRRGSLWSKTELKMLEDAFNKTNGKN